MSALNHLWRENIRQMVPYSSARDEYQGQEAIWLDANENPFPTGLNRYPDPYQRELKAIISRMKAQPESQLFLGHGSDEAIDLLLRATCDPGKDNILICPPTYGMYRVAADIQGAGVVEVPLTSTFNLDTQRIVEATNQQSVKLIFICSPNNPTGNLMDRQAIETILSETNALVVIDEAYVDFAGIPSWIESIEKYSNLLVLQTFSKAWGMAGARLGMAWAQPEIIQVLNRIKPPYNINQFTLNMVSDLLSAPDPTDSYRKVILRERKQLQKALQTLPFVQKVFRSDANFLLVQVEDAKRLYDYLVDKGIVVRNRHSAVPNTIRITIGQPEENTQLLNALKQFT